jgi:hypothetical protein
LNANHQINKTWQPNMEASHRNALVAKWHLAIEKSFGWM